MRGLAFWGLAVRITEADLDVHGADGTRRLGDSYRLITAFALAAWFQQNLDRRGATVKWLRRLSVRPGTVGA